MNHSSSLKNLDFLRGFLCIYVLAGHCRWLLWSGYESWSQEPRSSLESVLVWVSALLRYGHEAVIVFFVLSGFFIHLRIAKQLSEESSFKFNLQSFIQRRVHRLLPPYLLALVITVVFDYIGITLYPTLYSATTGDQLLDLNFSRKGYSLTSVIPALFILPSSLHQDFGTNGPLWSLSYEILYYCIYPIWLFLRKRGLLISIFIVVMSAVLTTLYPSSSFIPNVIMYYPTWIAGALLAELYSKNLRLVTLDSNVKKLTVSLSLALSFALIHISALSNVKLYVYILLSLSIVIIILNTPSIIRNSYFYKAFHHLGLKSYTIYICHFPIVTLLSAWIIETQAGRPSHGWLSVGGFFATLLICNLLFYLCENRFLHSRIKIST